MVRWALLGATALPLPSSATAATPSGPVPQAATVVTVGPGGDHATIGAALAAVVGADGDREIRIAAGTYAEALLLSDRIDHAVVISGGWATGFAEQTTQATVVAGPPGLVTATIGLTGSGSLTLDRLTFDGGRGLTVQATGLDQLRIERCTIRNMEGARSAGQAPLAVQVFDTPLVFVDNVLSGNYASEPGPLFVLGAIGSTMEVTDNRFHGNLVSGDASSRLLYLVLGSATGVFRRNEIADNDTSDQPGVLVEVGANAPRGTPADLLYEANLQRDNGASLESVRFSAVHGSRIVGRSSLLADHTEVGVLVATDSESSVDLVNLTVLNTTFAGVWNQGAGPASLTNTITLAPQPIFDSLGTLTLSHNWTAGDPHFVDAAGGDYRLSATSPAIDAGRADPPGGLGEEDLGGAARLHPPAVDLGAYEAGPGPCATDYDTLCLGSRFAYDVSWQRANGTRGRGQAVSLTPDTGFFWFFNPANVEMITKTVNGCPVNQRAWVFAGGLTNVGVTLAVTDTHTGEIKLYRNPLGQPFLPIQDTQAFAACGN
jgi:hypothetical protein